MDYSDPKAAEKEFEELCFAYGLELDEVTSKRIMEEKEKGEAFVKENLAEYMKEHGDNFEKTLWKVDIPANRYDLLCIEGKIFIVMQGSHEDDGEEGRRRRGGREEERRGLLHWMFVLVMSTLETRPIRFCSMSI